MKLRISGLSSHPINILLCEDRAMKYRKFLNPDIESIFNNHPKKIRDELLFLRELIFQIAEETKEVGMIEETLKWENPSYLTYLPKSGTTIRISKLRSNSQKYAISVHCQTTLVAEFKELYPEQTYDGNRSIIFDANTELPLALVKHFIFLALTYHHRKKHGIGL